MPYVLDSICSLHYGPEHTLKDGDELTWHVLKHRQGLAKLVAQVKLRVDAGQFRLVLPAEASFGSSPNASAAPDTPP